MTLNREQMTKRDEIVAKRNEIHKAQMDFERLQREELQKIIDKLYNHPIAMMDEHYNFFKELYEDLEVYKVTYL